MNRGEERGVREPGRRIARRPGTESIFWLSTQKKTDEVDAASIGTIGE